MKNIVYALQHKNKIYYVGKSTNLQRPYCHRRSHNKELSKWVNGLANYPLVIILENNVDNIEERERFWINEMTRLGHPLFNKQIPTERQLRFIDYQVGLFVKEQRKLNNLTQTEFAKKSGLGLRFVRDLEQGKESCRMDKVLHALSMFGANLIPVTV